MSNFKSISELKYNLAHWLMRDNAVRDMIVTCVLEDSSFEQQMERIAEESADDAVSELQREWERNGIKAGDVDGLMEEVESVIEQTYGTEEFDRAVANVIDERERDELSLIDQLAGMSAEDISILKTLLGVQ